jgi:methionyl-tRNA formyltransferase
MKIIFFGTPHIVLPVLQTLIKNFSVQALVTAPDQKAGRKQLLTPSPVKKYAVEQALPLPVLTPKKFDDETLKQIRSLQPDLFVVAAYGAILPKELLVIPPFGAINIHPSLLPRHRGATPVPSTILSGDTTTGVTIIKMDEHMDHGPIIAESAYDVHETDTTESLLTHLFNLSAEVLPDVITGFTSGKLIPRPQDETKATYTKKIEKDDGFIDLENLPGKEKLNSMIRAYYPWPGVWTRVKIKNNEARIKFLPGNKIQMEGKNPVTMREFINGYPEMKDLLGKLFDNLTA